MEAYKHIIVPLLALSLLLGATGCASVKGNGKPKGWAHSHHSKSKLRYKI
jgi:hypothetical protein